MLTESIESTHSGGVRTARLGDEQRITLHRILLRPRLKPRVVDVGREHGDGRGTRPPHVDEMGQRTCRRILPGLSAATIERSVDVERHLCGLTRTLRQLLHIHRVMPCHENLVAVSIRAEHLRPRSAVGVVAFRQLGVQRLAVLLKIIGQLSGHNGVVSLRCQWRVIACRLQHSYLILHLCHYHHLAVGVLLRHMVHQFTKRFAVGRHHLWCECRRYLQLFATRCDCTWKALRVALEPLRGVAAHGVLPCAKPQYDDLQPLLSRRVHHFVDEGEVECTLLWLKQFPIDGHQHGVQSQTTHARQYLAHVIDARRGTVAQFATQYQLAAQHVETVLGGNIHGESTEGQQCKQISFHLSEVDYYGVYIHISLSVKSGTKQAGGCHERAKKAHFIERFGPNHRTFSPNHRTF